VSRLALGGLLLLLTAAAWGTPSVSRFQLANGLQVIVERVPNAPLTAIEVWVRVGVAQETAKTSGVAHLLEHLLFRGAVGLPPDALDSAFENAGGVLDASTERDWTRFRASVLPDRWREPLQTLLRSLLAPALPADALEKERHLILRDEYALHNADPIRPARYALFAERFPQHPYGLPLLGDPSVLANITIDAIRQFHQAHYRPDRLVVVVVGAAEPDAVRQAVEAVINPITTDGAEPAIAPLLEVLEGVGFFSRGWHGGRDARVPSVARAGSASVSLAWRQKHPARQCRKQARPRKAYPFKLLEVPPALRGEPRLVPPAGRGNLKEGVVATLALSLATPPAQDIDGWLCAEVLRVALAEPHRGLLYEGEPPFGRLVSEYLPRLQGSLLALYALPPVQAVDDWQAQTRQRLERALQQIAAGERRAALEGARATVLARHTAAMRNPSERARWYGLCAALNLPLTPEAFAERLRALPVETIEAFAARLHGESPTPVPAAPAQTPPPSPALPDLAKRTVARQRLANGLRVLALTAPDAESVVVQVAVGHALGESPAAGELTMRMLFGATQNETERTLAMRIAQSGGSLRIEWTHAGALITAYARPDSVVNVLSLLKEALFRAEFDEDALQRARHYALYDRRYQEGAHAWRLTARLLGGYADEDALARVRLDDIRAYYRAHYHPRNAVIAVAGNMPAERLAEFVRTIFGGAWDGVGYAALPSPAEQRLRFATVADLHGLHYTGYGWVVPIACTEDYYALLAWQFALGEGKRAQLFVATRETRGVGYYIRAETWLLRGACVGVGWLQTGKAPADETLLRDALAAPLTDAEFQRACALLRGEWERLRLNLPALTAALAWAELSGLGYETVWNAPTHIESLTREAVQRARARLGE
jgi:predicted Zn-dependent peptidase